MPLTLFTLNSKMKKNTRHTFDKLIGAFAFVTLLFFGLYIANLLCMEPKDATGQWTGWDTLPKHSVDVLFLGNSHTECTIAPLQLFEETGIRSWDLKSSGCNMPLRYFYLKQAYKTQNPKVVALEMYGTVSGRLLNDGQNLAAYGSMPLGISRLIAASVTATPTAAINFAFPIMQNHMRLQRIERQQLKNVLVFSEKDYSEKSTAGAFVLDQPLSTLEKKVYDPWRKPYPVPSARDYEIQVKYVKRIIELAHSHHSKIILWTAPTQFKGSKEFNKRFYDDAIVGTENVSTVNLQDYISQIGLKGADFRDEGHLYVWGQKKTTSWFGQYLLDMDFKSNHDRVKDSWWSSRVQYWNMVAGRAIENSDVRKR